MCCEAPLRLCVHLYVVLLNVPQSSITFFNSDNWIIFSIDLLVNTTLDPKAHLEADHLNLKTRLSNPKANRRNQSPLAEVAVKVAPQMLAVVHTRLQNDLFEKFRKRRRPRKQARNL